MTTEQEPTAENNTLDYKYIGIILIVSCIFLPELMINVLTAACYFIALISILSSCILLGTIFALIMAATSLKDNQEEIKNNLNNLPLNTGIFQQFQEKFENEKGKQKEKCPNKVMSTADLD